MRLSVNTNLAGTTPHRAVVPRSYRRPRDNSSPQSWDYSSEVVSSPFDAMVTRPIRSPFSEYRVADVDVDTSELTNAPVNRRRAPSIDIEIRNG